MRLNRGRHHQHMQGRGHTRQHRPCGLRTGGRLAGAHIHAQAGNGGRAGNEARSQGRQHDGLARLHQPPRHVRQRLDDQQHDHQAQHHLRVQQTLHERLVGHQREHQQHQRRQHQGAAHLARLQPVVRKLVQRRPQRQQARHHHRQGGRQQAVAGAQHANQVGQQQGDFSGNAGVFRTVAGIGHHAQRGHKRGTSPQQHHRARQRRCRPRQAGQCERAHPCQGTVRPAAFAAFALNAHQQPTAQSTGQHGQRGIKTLQILHARSCTPRVPFAILAAWDVLHNPRESVVVRIGIGCKASFCSQ